MKSSPNKAKVKKPMLIFLIAILSIVGVIAIYLLATNMTQIVETLGWSNHSGMLKIVKSPWTGWSLKQPKDTIEYVSVEEGQVISLGDSYDLNVDEVTDESLDLYLRGLFLRQGDGLNQGIDLDDGCLLPNDFTLARGETIELTTCTMDTGTTWIVTYIK